MGIWLAGAAESPLSIMMITVAFPPVNQVDDNTAATFACSHSSPCRTVPVDMSSVRSGLIHTKSGGSGYGGGRMHAIEFVFAIGWAVFWAYWLVAALSMKRQRIPLSRELRIRLALFVLVVILLRIGAFQSSVRKVDPWLSAIGLTLFAAGLGFAVWARIHIGRNWGTPMSQKADPELVTSGPYQLVRHPIYSGILVAGVGTAVSLSWSWLIAVALAGIYFVYSATIEERNLTQQFPDAYAVYKRSTKMLVPFIV